MVWTEGTQASVAVGGGGGFTLSVAWHAAFPPAPENVPVKMVVVAGEMLREPFSGTLPTPLSIVPDVALDEVQESVALCPAVIVAGESEMAHEGALGGGGGFTVTWHSAV